jgi:hypothetical protein
MEFRASAEPQPSAGVSLLLLDLQNRYVGGQRWKFTRDAQLIDWEETNETTVSLRFRLDDAWTQVGQVQRLKIFPPWLRERLPGAAPDRQHPLALQHPLRIVHQIDIETPKPLQAEEETASVEPGPFSFEYRLKGTDKTLSVYYALTTNVASLAVRSLEDYRKSLTQVQRYLDVYIDDTAATAAQQRTPSSWLLGIAITGALIMIALLAIVHRYQPYLRRPHVAWNAELAGRKGWLALLGIAVTLSPLRVALELWRSLPVYSEANWALVTTVGSSSYHPLFGALLIETVFANVTLLFGFSYLAYSYYAKRRSFPLLFVVLQLFSAAAFVVNELLLSAIGEAAEPEPVGQSARDYLALGVSVLWIFYVLNSKRVKATFLPPPQSRQRRRNKGRGRRRSAGTLPAESAPPPAAASM